MISNTTVKRNAPLVQILKKWVDGEEFLWAPDGDPLVRAGRIYVNFSSPHTNFNRSIPRDISASSLYKIAFQGMKGRYSAFELKLNGRILSISGYSSLPQGVADGSTIDVNIHETSHYCAAARTADQSEFEAISLVKVYRQANKVLFAY